MTITHSATFIQLLKTPAILTVVGFTVVGESIAGLPILYAELSSTTKTEEKADLKEKPNLSGSPFPEWTHPSLASAEQPLSAAAGHDKQEMGFNLRLGLFHNPPEQEMHSLPTESRASFPLTSCLLFVAGVGKMMCWWARSRCSRVIYFWRGWDGLALLWR
jgi:hypothetical protein